MKQLLMIVPFFPPTAGGGVYRPLGFVRNLESYGWRPTVITPSSSSFWIKDPLLLDDVPSTCEIHRTKTLSGQSILSILRPRKTKGQKRSSRGFGWLRRAGAFFLLPDSYVGWYPFGVRAGRKVLRSKAFDAIYSTSPPETTHLIGQRLHQLSGLPWIADFRDPWMNLDLLMPPTGLHRRIHRHLEESVCRSASVVVASSSHKDLLERRYAGLARPTLIRNGFDHTRIEAVSDIVPDASKFRITHAGMLTQERTAVPFLRALKMFLERVPEARMLCRVLFIGARESENDAEAIRLGLIDVVEFRDTASHVETLAIERASHVLLLIKHLNPAYNTTVPGKLYEYIGIRRPILALTSEGEAEDLVRELHRGEVVHHGEIESIANTIQDMFQKFREGTLDASYDLSPVPAFRRQQLTGQLCELLDRATVKGVSHAAR
ncbi:MAG: hypothetical protein O7D32_11625 [bacterium]|nr:hypothetical protein [bacterium]